jgi:putative spermidine/putrescine transport system permease protein
MDCARFWAQSTTQNIAVMTILTPIRMQKLRLIGIVLPLLVFMTVFFAVPVGNLLLRAIQEPELSVLAPNLKREIRIWSGEGAPPAALLAAFRDDLGRLQRERRVGTLAKRASKIDPAYREMIMGAARRAASDPPPTPEFLISSDPLLRDPATWTDLRVLFSPFTDTYLLATLDLIRDPTTGKIMSVPAEDAVFLNTLARTLGISLSVTLICLLLAYPLAYVITREGKTMQTLMLAFVLLPFWTSILVRSAAWLVLLQSNGLVNDTLVSLGVISEPLRLVYSRSGTILAMVHIQLPVTFLPIYSIMKSVPESHSRAAASMGARPLQIFRRVYLPQTLPGVAAGCLLTFILCLGYYITPALLGGPADQMLSYYVAYYLNQSVNWSMAAAISLILLIVTLVIYLIYVRMVPILRQTDS